MKLAGAFRNRRRGAVRLVALIAAALVAFLVIQLSAGLVRAFWIEPFEMKTAAMAPAIAEGDHVLVYKRAYRAAAPAVGDIVLVRDGDGIAYIRRVVARRDELFTVNGADPADRPMTVPPGAILGKVIAVFWSAAAQRWQWEAPQ